MNAISTWRFDPVDTLFFRDSRPHSLTGAAVLGSLFPPSARTVAGAVRFLIGEALGAEWRRFGAAARNGERYQVGGVDLIALMGSHDTYGSLSFSGPWLAVETKSGWQRLYPAPRHLMMTGNHVPDGLIRIGAPVHCDLGRVRLPETSETSRDLRPAEDLWLDAGAYRSVLNGETPRRGTFHREDLFDEEPRLGIGRNLDRFSAESGLLYQTRHIRTRERSAQQAGDGHRRLAVEIEVRGGEGMPEKVAELVRLGGEGRLASVSQQAESCDVLQSPEPKNEDEGLILALLTPAPIDSKGSRWLPPGFVRRDSDQETTWIGSLRGIRLVIHTAVLGKAQREGGWDLAKGAPRPVRSLLPAGSAYFATVHDEEGRRLQGPELAPAIEALHLTQLVDHPLGYGQLAVGTFDASVFPSIDTFHL